MKVFLDSHVSLQKIDPIKLDNSASAHVIGVFSHHRDVKVVLEELREAGFPNSLITLVTSNHQYNSWFSELNIAKDLNWQFFDSNRGIRNFFQRLFQQGKYFLLVQGNEVDLNSASSIMGRRHGHGEVWHNYQIQLS